MCSDELVRDNFPDVPLPEGRYRQERNRSVTWHMSGGTKMHVRCKECDYTGTESMLIAQINGVGSFERRLLEDK